MNMWWIVRSRVLWTSIYLNRSSQRFKQQLITRDLLRIPIPEAYYSVLDSSPVGNGYVHIVDFVEMGHWNTSFECPGSFYTTLHWACSVSDGRTRPPLCDNRLESRASRFVGYRKRVGESQMLAFRLELSITLFNLNILILEHIKKNWQKTCKNKTKQKRSETKTKRNKQSRKQKQNNWATVETRWRFRVLSHFQVFCTQWQLQRQSLL